MRQSKPLHELRRLVLHNVAMIMGEGSLQWTPFQTLGQLPTRSNVFESEA